MGDGAEVSGAVRLRFIPDGEAGVIVAIDQVAAKTAQLGTSSKSSAAELSGLNAQLKGAAGAINGSFLGSLSKLDRAMGKIGKLAGAAGPIGLAIAAVGALKGAYDWLTEATEKTQTEQAHLGETLQLLEKGVLSVKQAIKDGAEEWKKFHSAGMAAVNALAGKLHTSTSALSFEGSVVAYDQGKRALGLDKQREDLLLKGVGASRDLEAANLKYGMKSIAAANARATRDAIKQEFDALRKTSGDDPFDYGEKAKGGPGPKDGPSYYSDLGQLSKDAAAARERNKRIDSGEFNTSKSDALAALGGAIGGTGSDGDRKRNPFANGHLSDESDKAMQEHIKSYDLLAQKADAAQRNIALVEERQTAVNSALGAFGDATLHAAAASLLLGQGFEKALNQELKGLAVESAVMTAKALAYGFFALGDPFTAPFAGAYFTSAAEFGAMGIAAGVGAAVTGGLRGGGSSGGGGGGGAAAGGGSYDFGNRTRPAAPATYEPKIYLTIAAGQFHKVMVEHNDGLQTSRTERTFAVLPPGNR